jgi:hypothetical protein
LARLIQNALIYGAFAVAAGAWAVPRALQSDDGTASRPPVSAGLAASFPDTAASPPTESLPPVGAVTEPADPAQPGAAVATVAAGGRTATPAPAPVTRTAVANTADAEIAATNTLGALGKRYLQALIGNDAVALGAMLSERCASDSAATILSVRRAQVAAEAGSAVEAITPLNAVVAHLDVAAGEAHTVLQFVAMGRRVTLSSADGWLLEAGAWRNAECGGPIGR